MHVKTFGVIGAGQMGGGHRPGRRGQRAAGHPAAISRGIRRARPWRHRQKPASAASKRARSKQPRGEGHPLAGSPPSPGSAAMRSADFVVEAASENEEIKFKIFRQLDEICPPHAILASNTSSIPIGRIASQTRRPDKVIGMHFMNPVPVMKLVEVIRGLATSRRDLSIPPWTLCEKIRQNPGGGQRFPGLHRQPDPHADDQRGHLLPLPGRGQQPKIIDTVMRLGMNHPMGPLALADLIGLDTCLAIMETLHQGFGRSEVPALPAAPQVCRGRLAGPQDRQGLLPVLITTEGREHSGSAPVRHPPDRSGIPRPTPVLTQLAAMGALQ